MSDFRLYEVSECGKDGYPLAWHETLKHEVRALAGNRCVRCKHPYENGKHGKGEWTPCDSECVHLGPGRHRPTEVDFRAAQPAHLPPIINPDGWVYFDSGDIRWMVAHGWTVEAGWRILTVHHLDGNKRNCRWWNLAPLCQRCHLEIQGRVKVDQVYPWEHSKWFKPYAAGFYAWHYLHEDLTREEVATRQSELLALECLV